MSSNRGTQRERRIRIGERARPRMPRSAPSPTALGASRNLSSISPSTTGPTGEGAGRNTRGGACTPHFVRHLRCLL